MSITRRQLLGAAAATSIFLPARGVFANTAPTIRIGFLLDMAGPYADVSGETSVICARQAVKDSGILERGFNVEIVAADHQQKADVGNAIIREWIDTNTVDVVAGVNNSAIALGAVDYIVAKDKVFLATGPASIDLTGKACSPNTVHWALDTYCRASSTSAAMLAEGGDTWYFVTPNYAFGKSLQEIATGIVNKANGKVLGSVSYPFPGTEDFSSFLLSASAEGPKVIAFAGASADLANCMKQLREFGLDKTMKAAALSAFVTDIHAMGLEACHGLNFTELFYWDRNDKTRAFTNRVKADIKNNYPNTEHAASYAATLHYLKALGQVGADKAKGSGREMVKVMKSLKVEDDCFGTAAIREDGRVMVPSLLLQAKSPYDSAGEWDLCKVVRETAPETAFHPISDACDMSKM
ncbi:MAG: hypothetical protein RLZZ444_2090 [Pseudomonadota bacterium]|jgi:branched-chain amino acid transport system substrate-binding protein